MKSLTSSTFEELYLCSKLLSQETNMDLISFGTGCFPLIFVLIITMCTLSGNTLFLFSFSFLPFVSSLQTIEQLLTLSLIADCYDSLDPSGNIAVTYDIVRWTDDGYQARITIQNYHQYRHIEKPGWQLGWTWAGTEVIWSMSGAFTTKQGNCSTFKSEIPHCCKKDPIIVDLAPEAPLEKRSDGCCHGGFLAASAINPSGSSVSFDMKVGNLRGNYTAHKPLNLTLMAPGLGYTCDEFVDTDPTISSVIEGKRQEQVIRTWKSTCTYSTFLANRSPTCCVSLSTFYNPEVTPCRLCSCGCKLADNEAKSCIRQSSSPLSERELVQCTDHMCPLRVHWHIMKNYRNYWRVKLTISNYNLGKNYSNWNVVVQHPGFSQLATVYSFNNTVLPTVGVPDEVALFWGLDFYNDALLQAEEKQVGSVTTEILLLKDMSSFTLSNGWAFPRRVYFNGENCEMPLPDTFPMLPNGYSKNKPYSSHLSVLVLIYLTYKTINFWS
nr:PREDICTED: COBRA-like protein 1 isoform X1 [Nicotiana tabacum]